MTYANAKWQCGVPGCDGFPAGFNIYCYHDGCPQAISLKCDDHLKEEHFFADYDSEFGEGHWLRRLEIPADGPNGENYYSKCQELWERAYTRTSRSGAVEVVVHEFLNDLRRNGFEVPYY